MERERTLQAIRRGRTAETRAEVHSYNAKRRLLRPPYDPYVPESTPSRRSLWHSLEDEAAKADSAAREEARAERWAALHGRLGRTGRERGLSRPANARARRPTFYFPAPPG